MPLQPNQRSCSLTESLTLAISAQAKKMRSEGLDVVSLSAGEPDFGTVGPVGEAGIQAIRDGETRYTAAAGTPQLRAAGAEWLNREFGLDYDPEGPELFKMWPTKVNVRIPELIAEENGLVQKLWITDIKKFNETTYRVTAETRIGSLVVESVCPVFLNEPLADAA